MIFHKIVVTALETNCYILSRDGVGAMIIDAGGEGERIASWLDENSLTPEWIVCTHGHGDHIGANKFLRKKYADVRIGISAADANHLTSPIKNMSVLMGHWIKSPSADLELVHGNRFEFQDLVFDVISVPGHTPGGICLYAEVPDVGAILFSGDALFAGAIGRSDIPSGDGELLIAGIREKLLTLPPETIVYPGHGPETTIAAEARNNPWL